MGISEGIGYLIQMKIGQLPKRLSDFAYKEHFEVIKQNSKFAPH